MASWSNTNKNTTTFIPKGKSSDENRTWNESTNSWDEQGQSTWDLILASFAKAVKNITSFTNKTKN